MVEILNQYRDKKRILLLFYPDDTSGIFQWQNSELEKNLSGMDDREVKVLRIFGERKSSIPGDENINEETANELRAEFGVAKSEYQSILLGKDGQIKYRDNRPVSMEDIFAIIDALPSRKDELKEKGDGM